MIESLIQAIIDNPDVAGLALLIGFFAGSMYQKRKMRKRGMGGMGF